MAEYRQYPDPTPRGRHAQRGSEQPAARPSDARQPAPRHGTSQPTPPHAARQQPRRPSHQQSQHATRQQAPQGYRPVQPGAAAAAVRGAGNGGRGGKGSGPGGKKKGGPWRVVFWVALAVLVAALAALGALGFSYWQGQKAYDAVAEDVFAPPEDIEGASLASLAVDWDKLKALNPDTVGWIYIPGTAVNYPVVHTTDDEKYLTTDFNGQQTWGATYGSIFLAAVNAADFSDANNIVYGHHLNNGSMFACLADFENADQFNAHRTAYLLTPQGNFKLRSFSLVHVAADDPLAQTAFASDEERTAYFQDKIDRSVVPAADAPAASGIAHAFAFATCDNLPSDGRYVLFSYLEESTVPGIEGAGGAAGSAVDPEALANVGAAAEEAAA